MNHNHHSNALLVELLIVVLFFMLASTVLLQLFASARSQGAQAEALTEATAQAQNVAEALYASSDAEKTLQELGFVPDGSRWLLPGETLTASVEWTQEETSAGVLNRYAVSMLSGDEAVLTLPCVQYEEAAA